MNNSPLPISPAWPTRWPPNSFRFLPTALLLLIVFAITLGVLLIFTLWLHATHRIGVTLVPALVAQLLIEVGVVIAILVRLPRLSGFTLRELGFAPPNARTLTLALLGAIAMAIVANGGASLIDSLLHSKHEQQVVALYQQVRNPSIKVFFAIFAVAVAPFAEEVGFRVFAFNFGLRYWGFWGGAILSGVLFGLAHGDIYAALPLALAGVVLCGVYYYTRNAYASMISHGLFNALTLVALLAAPHAMKH